MRYLLIVLPLLFYPAMPANAEVSVGIGIPGISIGINLPAYPELVPVPGYPVYYDPAVDANFFFYDGLYWVFQDDQWYESSWYNGPWTLVYPDDVPLFLLRIPVAYYRRPPPYFYGWRVDAPPHWGEHWGHGWERHRGGWDRWDRHTAPHLAPLPSYQRSYGGERYPRAPRQQYSIRSEQYHYQPHETFTRQRFQSEGVPGRGHEERSLNRHPNAGPGGARRGGREERDQGPR